MISARAWFSHAALLAASVTGCCSSTGWSPQFVTSSSSSLATHLTVDHLVASAQTYEKRGNAEKAKQLYEEVLEAYPGHPVAQKQYNRIIAKAEQQALRSMERRLALGQAFEQQGQMQRAKQVYAHILKAQPDHEIASRRMELLYAQENRNRTDATRLAKLRQEHSAPAEGSSEGNVVAAKLQVELSGQDKIEIEYKGGVERLTGIVADPSHAPKATKIVTPQDSAALEAAARRPKRVVIETTVVDAGASTPELVQQPAGTVAPSTPAPIDAIVVSQTPAPDRTTPTPASPERTGRSGNVPQRELDARVISERDTKWRPSKPAREDSTFKGMLAKSTEPEKPADPDAAKWHPSAAQGPALQPKLAELPAEQPRVRIEPSPTANLSAGKLPAAQWHPKSDERQAVQPQVRIEPTPTAHPSADKLPATQWHPKSEERRAEQPQVSNEPTPSPNLPVEGLPPAKGHADAAPAPGLQPSLDHRQAAALQVAAEETGPAVDSSTARANAKERDRSLERGREEVQHAVELAPIGPPSGDSPPVSESPFAEQPRAIPTAATVATETASSELALPQLPSADEKPAAAVAQPEAENEQPTRKLHEWYPETNGKPEFRQLFDEPKQPAVESVDPFDKAEIPHTAEPSAWHPRKVRDINDFVNEPESAIPEIAQFLRDPDPKNRSLAACLLSQVAPRSLGALPSLQSALRSEGNSMVRVYLAESVVNLVPNDPFALETLMSSLHDSDSRVRWLSACALGATASTQNQHVIAALTESLLDDHAKVRSMASLSLSEFGQAAYRALPTLQDALSDREDRVREAAAIAIARIGSREADEFTSTDQAYPSR